MSPLTNWLDMHQRFRPDAEAIYDVDNDRRWTYAALRQDMLKWCVRLRSQGVEAGDAVAFLSHNRGEHFALLFACAELGATFFPMNWRLSPAELRWQVSDSQPSVLLHDAEHAEVAAAIGDGITVLSVEDGPGELPLTHRGPGSELDQPWMLMYTSGTSGRPKGALLTHQMVHWNAVNTTLACDLRPDDATLTFTPMFHTGGMNCLSTPLLHRGGRVVITRGVDPEQSLRLIANEQITLLMGVPTIYQMLADHEGFAQANLTSVRDALCGGAPLSGPLLERYLDRNIPLRQGFGMTECGPNCFSMPPLDTRRKLGSVGKVIHHLEARLVRPDGTTCDVDEAGELWLRGPVLFGGYLGKEPPFVGDGWFPTGDVLSRDEEGFFTVRGRKKEMFISGGENVYPAEVEAAIFECPGVAQVAVVGVADERWGEVGMAFVEPNDGRLTGETIKAFLKERLARFKIPKHFVIRPLPRTASGKIDKASLAKDARA